MRIKPEDVKASADVGKRPPLKPLLMLLTAVVVGFVFWALFGQLLPEGWEAKLFSLVVFAVIVRFGLFHVHRDKALDQRLTYQGIVSKEHDQRNQRYFIDLIETGVKLQVNSRDWYNIEDRQRYDLTYGSHTKRLISFTKLPDKRLR